VSPVAAGGCWAGAADVKRESAATIERVIPRMKTSLSIRENECGRMLDPLPWSIHYLSVGPPAATPSSLATNGNATWYVTSAMFLAPAQSSVSRHGS
jgi:hypothetical protein